MSILRFISLHFASVLDTVPLNCLRINAVPFVYSLTFGTFISLLGCTLFNIFHVIVEVLNVLLFYGAIFLRVVLQLLPNCFTSCIPCVCFALHYPSPLYLHHTYMLRCFLSIVGVFFLLFTCLLTCLPHDANMSAMMFGSVEKVTIWKMQQ